MHNAGSLLVIFNSARLVRQGEELEPYQAVMTESDAGNGKAQTPAQLAPQTA